MMIVNDDDDDDDFAEAEETKICVVVKSLKKCRRTNIAIYNLFTGNGIGVRSLLLPEFGENGSSVENSLAVRGMVDMTRSNCSVEHINYPQFPSNFG